MGRKKIIRGVLAFLLTLALLSGSSAVPLSEASADRTAEEKAQALYELGLFRGKGDGPDGRPDFALGDEATRNEAATMLIRLLGRESKAAAQYAVGALQNPFTDVPTWAEANVTWLYAGGYVNGTGPDTYHGDNSVTCQQFCALALRSLGYRETAGDFRYDDTLQFAQEKGLLTAAQRTAWSQRFLRDGMAEICYNALYLHMRNSELTLLEKLTNDGIFKASYDTIVSSGGAWTLTRLYTGGGSTDRWSVEEPSAADTVCEDLDGDGKLEVIFAVRSLFCLDAADGSTRWSAPSGHDVTEQAAASDYFGAAIPGLPPLVLDVDGDGAKEIVTFFTNFVTDSTFVGIYDAAGVFRARFTTPHAVRAAKAADLDGDGQYELALGYGTGAVGDNLCLFRWNGTVLPGWPRRVGYGFFSSTIEAEDLDGDGTKELVLLFDEDQAAAFHMDGSDVAASGAPFAGLIWRGLPICENYDHEVEAAHWAKAHGGMASGMGDNLIGSTRERRNIIAGTYGGIVADDLDGDGKRELVCTSMVMDGGLAMRNGINSYEGIAQYFTTFLLNTDRTRYSNAAKGFDWRQMPTDIGEIVTLCTPPSTLDVPVLKPVTADLDGDGNKEILFSSFDGKVHCFSLDGTEHGAWPFSLDTRTTVVKSFATQPVAADLNGDGRPEIIFGTYTEKDQLSQRGRLYVLDATGRVLASEEVPIMWGLEAMGQREDIHYADGIRGVPAVADVDGDGRPEILVSTMSCGVCAYKVNS